MALQDNLAVGGTVGVPSPGREVVCITGELDCVTYPITNGNYSIVANIPKGFIPLALSIIVDAPEAAADNMDVGDSTGAARYVSNYATNGAAGTIVPGLITGMLTPYAAVDTLRVLADGANLTAFQARFFLYGFMTEIE
jgi:hypothetical protein